MHLLRNPAQAGLKPSLPCVKGGGTACRDGGIMLESFVILQFLLYDIFIFVRRVRCPHRTAIVLSFRMAKQQSNPAYHFRDCRAN